MKQNELKIGQKVKFDEEKRFRWTVRAVRENFAILTTLQFGQIWYTIIDFDRQVRGPDNCYGLGYETQKDIDEVMLALFGESEKLGVHAEVSHRHKVKLNISGVK